jgi:hypothetical protein
MLNATSAAVERCHWDFFEFIDSSPKRQTRFVGKACLAVAIARSISSLPACCPQLRKPMPATLRLTFHPLSVEGILAAQVAVEYGGLK